jgi:hypothetical protein
MANHPYTHAEPKSFWSRGVARRFDAASMVPEGALVLRRGDRVMSAGSCFAANIVPYLEKSGFPYVRTEQRHPLLRAPAENLGYDNFSAAYGNLYTARQLRQLLQRALGYWAPREDSWEDPADGTLIDPFRPGLRYRARSRDEHALLTRQHLDCVRRAFEEATVFVFTLGLTEAWVSRQDGAVFPACPGTVGGEFDAGRHAFHNFTVGEVVADMAEFIADVRRINPALRIVLTVSPVPLVATATDGHVLTSTIYSKSVLRVAAEDIVRNHRDALYFPAYEIVTGPQAPERFFEADRRNVSREAVDTVMAALLARCETDSAPAAAAAASAGTSRAAPPPAPPASASPPPASLPATDAASADAKARALSQAIAEAECEEAMSDRQAAAQ